MSIRQTHGFTLLEVLIALAIFSLVSMTAGSLLYQAVEAQSVSTRLADRLVDTERGLGRLSRDVAQHVPREVRDEFGDAMPALLISSDSLEFTRRGWANPAQHPRSELQRVRYWVEEDALRRAYWDVLDRALDSAAKIQTVIDRVSWVAFEPVTASQVLTGESIRHLGDDVEEPPIGLRISLQMNGYGELVRIIELPGNPAEMSGSEPETPREAGTTPDAVGSEGEDQNG